MNSHKEELIGTTSRNQNTETACKRLFDLSAGMEGIMARLNQPLENETQFNYVVATEIMQPLSGGVCIINKRPHGWPPDNSKKVVTPTDMSIPGLFIGKKILFLLSNKLRGATNQNSLTDLDCSLCKLRNKLEIAPRWSISL